MSAVAIAPSYSPTCRHCTRSKVNRPRGLCWACYYTPGVKDMFPSTSKYGKRGVGRFAGAAPLGAPTNALPGTPEKLAGMEARAAAGLSIFHPRDAQHDQVNPVENSRDA